MENASNSDIAKRNLIYNFILASIGIINTIDKYSCNIYFLEPHLSLLCVSYHPTWAVVPQLWQTLAV